MASNNSSFAIPSHYLPPKTPSAHDDIYADSPGSSIVAPSWGDATLLKDTKVPWGEDLMAGGLMTPFPPPMRKERAGKSERGATVGKVEKGKSKLRTPKKATPKKKVTLPPAMDDDAPAAEHDVVNGQVDGDVVRDVDLAQAQRLAALTRSAKRSRRQRETELPPPPPPASHPQKATDLMQPASSLRDSIPAEEEQPPVKVEVRSERKIKQERSRGKEVDVKKHQVIHSREDGPEPKVRSAKRIEAAVEAHPLSKPKRERVVKHSNYDLELAPAASLVSTIPVPPIQPQVLAIVSPPANLPADETAPLPPPTPATLRRRQRQQAQAQLAVQPPALPATVAETTESSDEASFGGLMEKLRFYKEKIGVVGAGSGSGQGSSSAFGSDGSTSSGDDRRPPPRQKAATPSAATSVPAPASARSAPVEPAPLEQPAMSLLAKLEQAARQSVRSVLPPSPPRPVSRPPPAALTVDIPLTAAPLPQAPLPPLPLVRPTEKNARKRPTVEDENTRPIKKPRPAVQKSKENAPVSRTRAPARSSPRKSPAKPKRRAVPPPPEVPVKAEVDQRVVVQKKELAAKRKDEEVVKRLQLEGASDKIKVLEEKKRVLVESIQTKHRIPSTSFEPILPPAVMEKRKATFASNKAVWEARTHLASAPAPLKAKAPRKSNYHPPPNWAALHAQEEIRRSRLAHKLAHDRVTPQPFAMATETRAREREQFEQLIREKEHLLEELREEKRREQEREEMEEVERLRRELDEKARGRVHELPGWMRKRAEELKHVGA